MKKIKLFLIYNFALLLLPPLYGQERQVISQNTSSANAELNLKTSHTIEQVTNLGTFTQQSVIPVSEDKPEYIEKNLSTSDGGIASFILFKEAVVENNSKIAINNMEVLISPNPMKSSATVYIKNYDATNEYSFVLYDILGKLLQTISKINQYTEITKENLQAGIYLYKVVTENGEINTGKLVVE